MVKEGTMPQGTTGSWLHQVEHLSDPSGESWKPSAGEAIAGKVIMISRDVGLNSASTHAQLATQDGEYVGVWLSSVLSQHFAESHVPADNGVAIKCVEWRENRRRARYKVFATKGLARGHEAESAPF